MVSGFVCEVFFLSFFGFFFFFFYGGGFAVACADSIDVKMPCCRRRQTCGERSGATCTLLLPHMLFDNFFHFKPQGIDL